MPLRDYQQRMDDERRASTAPSRCTQSPTGSGKSHMIEACANDAPSVVAVVHREFIVRQLAKLMPDAQVLTKGAHWNRTSKRVVGTIQTIARRSREDLPSPDQVIVDESHHVRGAQYQKLREYWPGAQHDGYTATPIRLDGQGLNQDYAELILGPQIPWLIDKEYLNPFEVYAVPSGVDLKACKVVGGDYTRVSQNDALRKSTVFGDVETYWRRYGRDGGHVSFWPSIEAAEHAADQVASWQALHSKLPDDEITKRIAALEAGSIDSLATVDMIGEGLDLKGIMSVSRGRATKSLGLFMQQNGRANRGGGGVARIINHVDDWREHHHGMPDDHREWTLDGVVSRRAAPGVIAVWDCPECWAVNRSQAQTCSRCGAPKPREIVVMEQRAAELELIAATSINDIHEHCKTGEDYVRFARAKGKKPSFGVIRYWERKHVDASDPFFEAMGDAIKPTLRQFVEVAKECGVHPVYAEQAGRAMRLIDDQATERMFRG